MSEGNSGDAGLFLRKVVERSEPYGEVLVLCTFECGHTSEGPAATAGDDMKPCLACARNAADAGKKVWLAGVDTRVMIHYVHGNNPEEVGWTPYAGMAGRFTRADAERAARRALEWWRNKGWLREGEGVPCVQHQDDAFNHGGRWCERLT